MTNWDVEVEPYERPFCKFAAGADWLAVGPIVTSPRDDTLEHEDLDPRARGPREDLVFGWLRLNASKVEIDALGTLTEVARTELEEWAVENGLELAQPSSPSRTNPEPLK